MRTFCCVVAFLMFSYLPGCSDAGIPLGVELNDQFKLAYAHTVRLPDGSEIYFKDVLEDSRCPVDVVCVWEGNTKVLLIVAGKEVTLNTALDPREVRCRGGTVRLLKVEPERSHRKEIPLQKYVITLIVEA